MQDSIPPALIKEIKAIRKDIAIIRNEMPDKEMFLTAEEKQLLKESYKNERKGLLISGDELKAQLHK